MWVYTCDTVLSKNRFVDIPLLNPKIKVETNIEYCKNFTVDFYSSEYVESIMYSNVPILRSNLQNVYKGEENKGGI